ncbi:MAG: tetratricopeptide repeat protein, partial [Candidatus Hydrogenedentota bacterium]
TLFRSDYVESSKWIRKAAEQGHVDAQRVLGVMYANGNGVPQDSVEAYMWLTIAASNGNRHAEEARRTWLSEPTSISKEQISEGDEMTRKWLEDFEKKNKE